MTFDKTDHSKHIHVVGASGHVILAHQRLGQLKDAGDGVYNAVMGGAHTKVIFDVRRSRTNKD